MTSSGTSTDPAKATRQRRALALLIASGALLAGWGFVMWHHRFRVTAPVVMLMLGWLAVLSAVYFLWRTADNADLDDEEDWWKPAGRIEELQREKRSLLKVIKEAELDRDTGKLSKADADDIILRYRARAIDVIKAIDVAEGGGDAGVRARIEREVRARLEVDKKAAAKKPAAAAAKPAVSVADAIAMMDDKPAEPEPPAPAPEPEPDEERA
jgi:hypothetical protein